jgi:hypothetical protein
MTTTIAEKKNSRRHILMFPIAAALVFGPLAFNSGRAEAMIGDLGLARSVEALSPIEKAGCWRYGWHGWGWYRCGWGWHRPWGWHRWGWHRHWGWHRWHHWRRW